MINIFPRLHSIQLPISTAHKTGIDTARQTYGICLLHSSFIPKIIIMTPTSTLRICIAILGKKRPQTPTKNATAVKNNRVAKTQPSEKRKSSFLLQPCSAIWRDKTPPQNKIVSGLEAVRNNLAQTGPYPWVEKTLPFEQAARSANHLQPYWHQNMQAQKRPKFELLL